MQNKLRVLISGGGTGGHVFPAIAIANEIMKKYPDAAIEFVGASGRMEMEKVPAAGYKIHGLWISGFQRSWSLQNLMLPFKVIFSLLRSYRIVKAFKPTFTVGVGGYASGPLNYMASKMSVPVYLQEQNSYPGITNKLLKNIARKICVAYDGMELFFPDQKIVVTGNPIRQDLLADTASQSEARDYFRLANDKKTVLVVGGSLGARTINEAIMANLEKMQHAGIQLLWQTGKNFSGEFGDFSWGTRTAFIQRMDLAYQCADVVISRAGAMSVSELAALGKPTIFIPSPFVAEDHQTKNAMSLVQKNAALLCKDVEATENIADMLLELLRNQSQLDMLSKEIIKLGKPNAAESIVNEIIKDLG